MLRLYQSYCMGTQVRSCDTGCYDDLPVGGAVGRLAAVTQRGSRTQSQSEPHRAVIPPDVETRRGATRPDSDHILQSHAVHNDGGLRRREEKPLNCELTKHLQDYKFGTILVLTKAEYISRSTRVATILQSLVLCLILV